MKVNFNQMLYFGWPELIGFAEICSALIERRFESQNNKSGKFPLFQLGNGSLVGFVRTEGFAGKDSASDNDLPFFLWMVS